MAKNIAGRILIMPRGTYDANATYEMLDLVMYNNASWLAKKTATGIEPTNDEYWHKMADGVELVTNLTTEVEGKALDASMGKVLKDLIDAVGADALRERLTALDEASATHSEDIETLRLAIEEFGNIDTSTVMYDADTDSLKVLKNGEWVETSLKARTEIMSLYVDGEDYARFISYAGGVGETSYGETVTTPTLTKSGEMVITLTNPNDSYMRGSVVSASVDFTGYNELKFTHTSTTAGGNGVTRTVLIITPVRETLMTPVSSLELSRANANPTVTDEDVTIDVSELSGEYHIGIFMRMYGKVTSRTSIKNMYLE